MSKRVQVFIFKETRARLNDVAFYATNLSQSIIVK